MGSHRRTGVVIACFTVALAVAFALSRVPEQVHSTEIIPGYSIGPVTIGETGSGVLSRLGHGVQTNYKGSTIIRVPNSQQPNPSTPAVMSIPRRTVVRYPRLGLTMVIADNGAAPDQVMTVSTSDPRYRTADGIGVGSPISRFRGSDNVVCDEGQCDLNPPFWGPPWTTYRTRHGRVSHITILEPTPGIPQGADVMLPPGLHLSAGT